MKEKYLIKYKFIHSTWYRVTFRNPYHTFCFLEVLFDNEWKQDVKLYINDNLVDIDEWFDKKDILYRG